MYLVYLLKEKRKNKVIYVGSSARPAERMKEHLACLRGDKPNNQKIYHYMREHKLQFYKDVEIIWVDCASNKDEMLELEAQYYERYKETVLNERPAENRYGGNNPKHRWVKCLSDGLTFKTVTECAEHYGFKRTTLSGILNGSKKNRTGLKFLFKGVEV